MLCLGTSLGTTFTMVPPRLFQIMSQYMLLIQRRKDGDYLSIHLVSPGELHLDLVPALLTSYNTRYRKVTTFRVINTCIWGATRLPQKWLA